MDKEIHEFDCMEMETNENCEIKNDFDQNFVVKTDHDNCEIKNVFDQNFVLEKGPLEKGHEMETNENCEIKIDFDQNYVLKTDHENKKTMEECKFCGKKFVNINKHLLTHSPRTRNPYACTLCNSVFPNRERHNWHIKNHHDCEIKNVFDQNFVLEKGPPEKDHEMETNDNCEIKNDFDQNVVLETDQKNCEIKNAFDQNFVLEKGPLKVENI